MQKRRTKILATLGPATDDPAVLEGIVKAGVDVVRLNFSHGKQEDHAKRAEQVREIARSQKRPVGVLADLQGPKIRIECFKDGPVELEEGQTFSLDAELATDAGTIEHVGIAYKELPDDMSPKDILLLDVTPLTLSIETLGSVATALIERNTTIPTRKSQIFSTASDSQSQVEINVLQGERPMANDNKSLGRFALNGIPPAPRGIPQIDVTFDIDANGILKVTAQDKATGRSQNITITASSGLSDEEVESMRKDAEQHAADDLQHKNLVEARNSADNTAYTAEKVLKDLGDKVPADMKSKVEDGVVSVREVMDSDDIEAIRKATEDLNQIVQQIGAAAYAQADPAEGEPSPDAEPETDNGTSDDEDVVDGEFEDA